MKRSLNRDAVILCWNVRAKNDFPQWMDPLYQQKFVY